MTIEHMLVIIDGEPVMLIKGSYGDYYTPYGYCRKINDKSCGCTVAWSKRDGTCPCAPGDKSNPLCRNFTINNKK